MWIADISDSEFLFFLVNRVGELRIAPIDFFVFGFIVMGGAWGLPLISLIDELAVPAMAALIYWVAK